MINVYSNLDKEYMYGDLYYKMAYNDTTCIRLP